MSLVFLLVVVKSVVIGCTESEPQNETPIAGIGDDLPAVKGVTPPLPTLKSGNVEIPVVLGSYAWNTVTDMVGPLELLRAKGYEPVSLAGGTEIEVYFDYEPNPQEVVIREVEPSGEGFISEQELEDDKFIVSGKPGRQIYAIDARWGVEGNVVDAAAMYYFQVSIVNETLDVALDSVLATLDEAGVQYAGRNESPSAYDFQREGAERYLYKLEPGKMTVYIFDSIEQRREVQRDPFPLAGAEPPNGSYGMGKVLVFYYDGDKVMAQKLRNAFEKLGAEEGIQIR